MPSITRPAAVGLAALVLALTPAVALGDHGGDDVGFDDNGGQRDDRGDDDEQRVAGSCTGRSTAKLKVKHDDGRIEAEFEVDQNRAGVTWRVRIRDNDRLVVKTRATTTARSGSFSVERKIADAAGTDRIKAKAVSPSGEICTASASI
jgi:hypothetical protein